MRRFRHLVRPLEVPIKVALLAVVFVRFHGTWVGASVVLGMAFLLFGVDRTVRRWASRAIAGK